MIVWELYLLCISLLVKSHQGKTKPQDIHIHLHGVVEEAPTQDKPRNRIGWLIPGIIIGKLLAGPKEEVINFLNQLIHQVSNGIPLN
jgi:hypothetical protein